MDLSEPNQSGLIHLLALLVLLGQLGQLDLSDRRVHLAQAVLRGLRALLGQRVQLVLLELLGQVALPLMRLPLEMDLLAQS